MKLNLKNIINTLKDIRDYTFPIKRFTSKFKNINSKEDLKSFIQERSAHVTQSTLYGYIKTRIGSRYAMMFEDEVFSNSINIAKWNIYMSALSDLTIYVFSYLINKKNLKQNDAEEIFITIVENENKKQKVISATKITDKIFENAKIEFKQRLKAIDWSKHHLDSPFKNSGLALYKWSPIADELKILDKEIVLNSIKLKWNLIENEFKDLTKNLNFN